MKAVSLICSVTLICANLVAADPKYYLEVKTSAQGEIYPGPATNSTRNAIPPNSTPALGFNFTANVPSGGPVGTGSGAAKSQFGAVDVLKDVDSGTALLMQALITDETLPTVTLTAIDGGLTMTYKLTNAQLASIEHKGISSQLVEKLAVNFQKMEIDVSVGGSTTTAQFDN